MSKADVDSAFEWLVLIIGIVSAIMSQYPEHFSAFFPTLPGIPPSVAAARSLILPLVLTVFIWLVGKLIRATRYQAIIKMFAWMYALNTTWANIVTYLMGSKWVSIEFSASVPLGHLGFFLIVPTFTYAVVIPRYREIYPDSRFLRSIPAIIAALVLALLLFLVSYGIFSFPTPPPY